MRVLWVSFVDFLIWNSIQVAVCEQNDLDGTRKSLFLVEIKYLCYNNLTTDILCQISWKPVWLFELSVIFPFCCRGTTFSLHFREYFSWLFPPVAKLLIIKLPRQRFQKAFPGFPFNHFGIQKFALGIFSTPTQLHWLSQSENPLRKKW